MPQDAGDYVCQISDLENRDQIHTVEILGKKIFHVLPKISKIDFPFQTIYFP